MSVQQDLLFKLEDMKMLEKSQEDVRIQKLCKQIRLALHLIDDVMKKIKEKTP